MAMVIEMSQEQQRVLLGILTAEAARMTRALEPEPERLRVVSELREMIIRAGLGTSARRQAERESPR